MTIYQKISFFQNNCKDGKATIGNFCKHLIRICISCYWRCTGFAVLEAMHVTSAYRVDRPTINQAEASVFPSFFSQLKDWLFFCLNFPSLGLRKITAYQNILDLKFLQVFFKNRGEILVFKKNAEFHEFFGFTLCFRTFQAKKKFQNFSDW